MKRRVVFAWMVVSALVVVVPRVWAQQPPQTDPPRGMFTQDVVMSWDRSSVPADIELWAPRTLLAYDTDLSKRYGELYMVCASATDTSTGRCPVEDMLAALAYQTTPISIRFEDARTGLLINADATAALYRADSSNACSLGYWAPGTFGISSSVSPTCDPVPAGTGKSLALRAADLSKLTAGHWKGTLELRLRRPPAEHLATYVFNFDFTVTDHDAALIYLPAFEYGNAHVNLDLRYDPIAKMIGGRKDVDMCLYDGVGSSSEYLGVTVRDAGPHPSGGDGFSVWHPDTTGDESERVDFDVLLDYAGNKRRMRNGVEEQLHGVDSAALRLVKLPKLDQPVYCVPTPLTLLTPQFPSTSKRQGVYSGELKVELRVPAARP
ncbi:MULTISPECIES: CfaE/CblD family pilus tip adhesin [Stenotrophomonas]|uniref:CfaE/CblD family pilus tip adhesin n=1 Tax=Stenotrophomonas TaxID=40323 RepID=UPI00289C18ED|nr:CfaE/CblD family pilus tip adhesin [Stenotrophomonas sp.]